ncbi:hypothetical protein PLICRDRAFT_172129 [Plicaturopsis crispa FD-325 SS-3]|nr:hypothetical protein PLICRDRAFT_172129 [Plicaturopsis crispa FD-325 SS-3]
MSHPDANDNSEHSAHGRSGVPPMDTPQPGIHAPHPFDGRPYPPGFPPAYPPQYWNGSYWAPGAPGPQVPGSLYPAQPASFPAHAPPGFGFYPPHQQMPTVAAPIVDAVMREPSPPAGRSLHDSAHANEAVLLDNVRNSRTRADTDVSASEAATRIREHEELTARYEESRLRLIAERDSAVARAQVLEERVREMSRTIDRLEVDVIRPSHGRRVSPYPPRPAAATLPQAPNDGQRAPSSGPTRSAEAPRLPSTTTPSAPTRSVDSSRPPPAALARTTSTQRATPRVTDTYRPAESAATRTADTYRPTESGASRTGDSYRSHGCRIIAIEPRKMSLWPMQRNAISAGAPIS